MISQNYNSAQCVRYEVITSKLNRFYQCTQIQRSVRYNGMVMIYSPLFAKIWRLYRLFYNKQLRIRVSLHVSDMHSSSFIAD